MSSLHAWVLLAISLATTDQPATLAKVIAAADAVNHSVLNAREIDSAFRALTSAGLIAPAGDQVTLTPKGEALAIAAQQEASEPSSWMSQLNVLKELIPQVQGIPLTEAQESRLPSGAQAEAAIQAYLARDRGAVSVPTSEIYAVQLRLVAQAASRPPLAQRVANAIARLLGRQ